MADGEIQVREAEALERRLDEALEATFPASDPVAVSPAPRSPD